MHEGNGGTPARQGKSGAAHVISRHGQLHRAALRSCEGKFVSAPRIGCAFRRKEQATQATFRGTCRELPIASRTMFLLSLHPSTPMPVIGSAFPGLEQVLFLPDAAA